MNEVITHVRLTLAAAFTIAAVSLAPLSAAQAQKPAPKPAANANIAAQKLNYKVRLTDGTKTVVRRRRDLGFALASANPVRFTVNQGTLKNALEKVAGEFFHNGQDARPYVAQGQVRITPGSFERRLNIPTTAEVIARTVSQKPGMATFRVALNKKPPTLTADRLKGINGVLGTQTTQASANSKRNKNIGLSIRLINGTLLSPGETFSLNNAVGQRTQARGFRTAPVFVNAEKVPGVGGGVSQVTGTLFNAAAKAGLKIVEVNPHSRPVAYLPIGYDATVAFGDKDLRFTNNTQTPVYLSYTFQNRKLTATVFGAKQPGRIVSLRPRVQRLGPGKVNAQLYRTIKQNGKVIAKEKLFSHAYRWDPNSRDS